MCLNTLLIRGGRPLSGQITVSGSKNAVLPMLAASVLFQKPCLIHGCPALTDVDAALEILSYLGALVTREENRIRFDPRPIFRWQIPGELMGKMRGSVFFTGPLLARFGRCRLTAPGGCSIGARPVDFHGMGFQALGAVERGTEFSGPLTGGEICLPYPSVGATENLLMAALGAEGRTVIHNAAREPEIVCLCDFLRSGGCRITGDGTEHIMIEGGLPDTGKGWVIPDRMEAATFACALACAGGQIRLNGADHTHLTAVLDALERSGCAVMRGTDFIELTSGGLQSPGTVITGPYPGFPTDAQAPFLAAMIRAEGRTEIRETVFDGRMGHVPALRAMGARIELEGNTALVTGNTAIRGAEVTAGDLRCGGALAVAALGAAGESRIRGLEHIRRGYENFAEKLRALGADAELA